MPLLEIRNLKKAYTSPDDERVLVVDIPVFLLEEKEQFAIFGTSGSGKTTFLNLISGILTPDSGSIVLEDNELTLLSEAQRDRIRGRSMGFIFQTFNLLQHYTALENVLVAMIFGHKPDRERAMELLDQVGLADRADYKPPQLSVGQQQRVAVARALANSPRLVLADEPTGNLDPARALEAVDLIRSVCYDNSSSLILVSHDVNILGRFEKRYKFESINNAIN